MMHAVLMFMVLSGGVALAASPEELTVILEADRFLGSISQTTDFDARVLKSHLEKLVRIEESSSLTRDEKVKVLLTESGLYGKQAEQSKSAQAGRFAFEKIKQALAVDAVHEVAMLAHATTVARFTEKSRVSRFFIEKSLNISIFSEAKLGVKNLEFLLAKQPISTSTQELLNQLRLFVGSR